MDTFYQVLQILLIFIAILAVGSAVTYLACLAIYTLTKPPEIRDCEKELAKLRQIELSAREFMDVVDNLSGDAATLYFDKYRAANNKLREALREYRVKFQKK